mmetsp:Transcript_6781/g.19553  ORF Transcript_6781/g.19553 Transcript_6781/m.19553 type:complete len:232 (-) Transcript_6781:84-779(-)
MVQPVQLSTLSKTFGFGYDFAVGAPEGAREAGTPRHAELGLAVPKVHRRVEHRRLPVRRGDVAAPQVPVQAARRYLDALEQAVQVAHQDISQLTHLPVTGQLQLRLQAPLPEEVHPVVHPAIVLRRAPYGVIDGKSKQSLGSLRVLWRRNVHLGEIAAQFSLAASSPKVEVLHHDEGPSVCQHSVVVDLGYSQRFRVIQCLQPQGLALEHAIISAACLLNKEALAAVGVIP